MSILCLAFGSKRKLVPVANSCSSFYSVVEAGRGATASDRLEPILVAELEAAAAGATYTPHADTEVLRSTVLENYRNR